MIIVSACLAGVNCRNDGCVLENPIIKKLVSSRQAMPLCPEVLGGRPVPRAACEITGGTARDVLTGGTAKVKDKDGRDVTEEILTGSLFVAAAAKRMNVAAVILKTKSPTCGCGKIYDGTFTGKLISGNGVLAEALLGEGIKVYTEEDCGALADELLDKNG
jgi:uncharacterized protein YbbK (DUF523 family)